MDIFYADTTSMVGNSKKTPFWHAPWLGGWGEPTQVAPLIFSTSKRKNRKVAQALHGNAWVGNVDLDPDFSMEHFPQFVEHLALIGNFQLNDNMEDDIVSRLTSNG
jgi:hypothetical protein